MYKIETLCTLNIQNWKFVYINVGGKDLNFYVGSQAPITNKSTFEEEKTFGKAP